MKKAKKKIRTVLLEIVAEIVLTLLCFGIGTFIIGLFGVSLDSPNIDGDLIILLGIAAFLVIFGAICALVAWFKKKAINKSK